MRLNLAGRLIAVVLLVAVQYVDAEEVVVTPEVAKEVAKDAGDWASVLGCVFKDEVSRCLQQRTMKAMKRWLETERVISSKDTTAAAKQDQDDDLEDQPDKDKGLLDQIGEFFSFGVSRFLQFVDDDEDGDRQEVEDDDQDDDQDEDQDEARSVEEEALNTIDTLHKLNTNNLTQWNDTINLTQWIETSNLTHWNDTIIPTQWNDTIILTQWLDTAQFLDTMTRTFNESDTFTLNGTDIVLVEGNEEGRHITQWLAKQGVKFMDKLLDMGYRVMGVKGRKKKKIRKLKALIKLLLLAKLIKEKIYLTLAKLGFLLQVKFFGVAVLNLLVNVGRLFFAWLKHKTPQKVIYYEHANHQHHYEHEHHHDYEHEDKKGWFGSLWSRSFETPKEKEVASPVATPYIQDYSVHAQPGQYAQSGQYAQNGQYPQGVQQYGQDIAYAGQKPQVRYRVVSQGHDDDDD